MLWIGITGPMGSGKSTVAHMLRQMGFTVLDADQVATKVLSPGSAGEAEVLRTFGEHLKNQQGGLDRRALGRLVFGQPEKLALLEGIIHPRVRDEVKEQRERLTGFGHKAAFYDVPLLFEKNMQAQFDFVLVVSAGKELRRDRVIVRSQLTVEEIEERNSRHIAPEIKEAAASAVIRNTGTVPELKDEILRALKKISVELPTPT